MLRKAKLADTKDIHSLISYWAKKGKVLERPLNYIYERLRDFWVYTEDEKILGCCALGIVGWQELGEIKSLVVSKGSEGRGIGGKLVRTCIEEAKELGINSVFALTFIPEFFKRLGFEKIDKKELPHKVWSDCIHCVHFPDCREDEVIFRLKK